MNHYLTLREVTEKTGLPKSRLRYIEARFPVSINRRLFDSEGRFYSPNQLKTFRQIDRLLQNNNGSVLNELIQRNHAARRGRIITFTSGKGGVGKTSLSVNLSLLAQSRGFRTALLDGDLGMADAHALLGMRPSKNISNLFTEHIRLKEVMLETYGGLRFVPGCSGEFNIANLDDRCLNLLAEEIQDLRNNTDWLVVDSPAGIGTTVLNWINASDEIVVVTTPSPTALLDAYGLIKVSAEKGYTNPIKIIVNMVSSQAQGDRTFEGLNQCSRKFLHRPLHYLGSVRKDMNVERSLTRNTPFVFGHYRSLALSNLQKIARTLFGDITVHKR